MKQRIMVIPFLFLSLYVYAQQDLDSAAIPPIVNIDSVHLYVNQTVTICDKIYGGIFLDKSKKRLTLLNMGGAYPKQKITVLIPDTCRFLFSKAPETNFKYTFFHCISSFNLFIWEQPRFHQYISIGRNCKLPVDLW